jgi:hypothetical protein
MKWGMVIVLILVAIVLLIFSSVWLLYATTEKSTGQPTGPHPKPVIAEDINCIELGCDSNTVYVGSKNSDKYYTCDCHYAKRILLENIFCFESDAQALNKGYEKIEDC